MEIELAQLGSVLMTALVGGMIGMLVPSRGRGKDTVLIPGRHFNVEGLGEIVIQKIAHPNTIFTTWKVTDNILTTTSSFEPDRQDCIYKVVETGEHHKVDVQELKKVVTLSHPYKPIASDRMNPSTEAPLKRATLRETV